jgi:hypothetical protein
MGDLLVAYQFTNNNNLTMKKALSLLALVSVFAPTAIVGAQPANIGGFVSLINMASDLINRLIPFIIALTVLVFLWGVFRYVLSRDSDSQKEAQGYMIWGIIALFVMVSVWGLVNILIKSFSLQNTAPEVPRLPVPNQISY